MTCIGPRLLHLATHRIRRSEDEKNATGAAMAQRVVPQTHVSAAGNCIPYSLADFELLGCGNY